MPRRPPHLAWRSWLALGLALFLLNLGLSFHNVWPTLWVETRHELSLEVAVLIIGLVLYAELFRPPPVSLARWLGVFAVLLVLGRYAQVTAPALYGRPINLYWDAQHLPAVLAMLARAAPAWQVVLAMFGIAALLAGLYTILRWALARVLRALARPSQRRALGLLSGGLVAFHVGGQLSPHIEARGWFSIPVTATYARQVGFLVEALGGPAIELTEQPPLPPSNLGAVAGADVLVVFVESYGATAFDHPAYAEALQPSRAAFVTALARSGREVVSAFVESPTFAGGSWRAHASLLSGLEVRDDHAYRLLLTRERDTLTDRFVARGYRPVALMPGLRRAWPEGRFYGFAALYGERRLDYQGPEFGWWRLPDQYALARFDRLELATRPRQPLFVFFPTISTHLPFRPIPPYQPDWRQILDAQPFDPAALSAAFARAVDWADLGPAYVEALDYAYAWLGGYLEKRAPADLVMVVLGDHQPAASVSGPKASWAVPVHVVSNRKKVLEALSRRGFEAGMTPSRPALGQMHELAAVLLEAFASDGDQPARVLSAALQPRIDVSGRGPLGQRREEAPDGVEVDPGVRSEPVSLTD